MHQLSLHQLNSINYLAWNLLDDWMPTTVLMDRRILSLPALSILRFTDTLHVDWLFYNRSAGQGSSQNG
jgi:hypothetical protein